jgi:predicted unusual protein kinase regulating ubiquinone biosynthesis (AarF/ABC1/UbiB family)
MPGTNTGLLAYFSATSVTKKLANLHSRKKRFFAVSYELNKIFFTFPFKVPDYFALLTRAMIVLEGIAVTGDPEFDLFSSAYPYAFKRAVNLFGFSDLSQIAAEAVKYRLKTRT